MVCDGVGGKGGGRKPGRNGLNSASELWDRGRRDKGRDSIITDVVIW